TPYADIFLTTAAMQGTCAQVVAKSLKFTQIDTAHVSTETTWPTNGRVNLVQQGIAIGQIINGGDYTRMGVLMSPPTDPFVTAPFVDPNEAGTTYTFPRMVVQLVGKNDAHADTTATICVPEQHFTRNSNYTYDLNRFFYDTTGTPYSDIFLTLPAMTGTCQQVVDKSLKFSQVDTAQAQTEGIWPINSRVHVVQTGQAIGQLMTGDWTRLGTVMTTPTDPLAVAPFVDPNEAGTTYTIPRTIAQLTGKDANHGDLTATICMPEQTFTRNANYTYTISRFFFDKTGTPYSDIFLTASAMTGTCAQVTEKALRFTQIDTVHATRETAWPENSSLHFVQQNEGLGSLTGTGDWTRLGTVMTTPTDPLAVAPFVDPNEAGVTVTVPRTIAQLIGKDAQHADLTKNVCVPETTFTRNSDSRYTISRFFFDKTGTPYNDIFLTTPAMAGSCQSIFDRAYAPAHINNVTMTPLIRDDLGVMIGSGTYLYGAVGSAEGWQDRQGQQGDFTGLPLFAILTGGTGTVNIPKTTIAITDADGQTKTLCWGGWNNVSAGDRATLVLYDKNGQGYKDLYLSQPYTCPDDSPSYNNVRVLNSTATSAVISWDTSVSSCGRINYGTVPGALNSGPALDTCAANHTFMTTGHQATLTNLKAGTTYYYEVVSLPQGSGQYFVSGQRSFQTPNAYSNIRVISTSTSGVTIGWDTAAPSCGRINYGTASGQLNSGPAGDVCWNDGLLGVPYATGHTAMITNLQPGTKYFYEIHSTGDLVSGQLDFTTTALSGGGGSRLPLTIE
ncbi:MAG: fibronectin type III domain-containing protein, partial [Candidatus Kerfeldbacteria bacterium]|nr:fibronectin type III domain-containing protein [Candidatus Kerfeldbacteria bacterium]